jgi:hypothetical protein
MGEFDDSTIRITGGGSGIRLAPTRTLPTAGADAARASTSTPCLTVSGRDWSGGFSRSFAQAVLVIAGRTP